jgi:hypothetical protein
MAAIPPVVPPIIAPFLFCLFGGGEVSDGEVGDGEVVLAAVASTVIVTLGTLREGPNQK